MLKVRYHGTGICSASGASQQEGACINCKTPGVIFLYKSLLLSLIESQEITSSQKNKSSLSRKTIYSCRWSLCDRIIPLSLLNTIALEIKFQCEPQLKIISTWILVGRDHIQTITLSKKKQYYSTNCVCSNPHNPVLCN
jgi:hypothetical protein